MTNQRTGRNCLQAMIISILTIILLWNCETPQAVDPYANWDYHGDFEYHAHTRANPEACKILIIGNSLTYFNDQVIMLRNLARGNHWRAFVDEISFPGVQLQQHCQDEYTLRKIKEQDWDFVILQEAVGEIGTSDGHEIIREYVEILMDSIYSNYADTRIFYFMPWGLKSGTYMGFMTIDFADHQMMLTEGTVEFAEKLDLMVAPVGQAWLEAMADSLEYDLFYTDGSHPSHYGSFLGAVVYFTAIFQDSLTDDSYSSERYVYLKNVAYTTVMDNLERWRIPVREDTTCWCLPCEDDLPPM